MENLLTGLPERAHLALAHAILLDGSFPPAVLLAAGFSPADLAPLFDHGLLAEIAGQRIEVAPGDWPALVLSSYPWSVQRQFRLSLAGAHQAAGSPCFAAAEQYLRAYEYGSAREVLLQAAQRAQGSGDYAQALDCLQRALDCWPRTEAAAQRFDTLLALVQCAQLAGLPPTEKAAWNEFLAGAEATRDPVRAAQAHAGLANLARQSMQFQAVGEHLREASRVLQGHPDVERRTRQALALTHFLCERLSFVEAEAAVEEAEQALEEASEQPGLRCEVLAARGLVRALRGDAAGARAATQAALDLAIRHQLPSHIALAQRRLANIADYASDYTGERDGHLLNIRYCDSLGAQDDSQVCRSCLAYTFFRTGQWTEALSTARQVRRHPAAPSVLLAIASLAEFLVHVFRGELRMAQALSESTRQALLAHNLLGLDFFVLWGQAELALQAGEARDAGARYQDALVRWRGTEDAHDAVPVLLFAAAHFGDQGDETSLAAVCEALHVIAGRNATSETRGAARAALGEVALWRKDFGGAATLLSEAVAEYQRVESLPERAHLFWRQGRALLLAGQRPEALEAWAQGGKLAQTIGWRPYLNRLAQARQSEALAESGSVALSPLTRRQHDVLALLAQGLSHKEAADRLSLSPRTVEMHMAHVLERLNCRTRAEAIRRASESGWLQA